MRITSGFIATFLIVTCLALASCTPGQQPETDSESVQTSTPEPTHTPEQTSTPLPTLTLTPTPVSLQNAARQKSLSEIEVFGKGRIQLRDFSPDGSLFVAVTARGIYVFNSATWEQIVFLPSTWGLQIHSIAFSDDSQWFAFGDSTGNVTIRDTTAWEVVKNFKAYEGPVTSVDISPDNLNCVTIGDEKEIAIWDLNKGIKINSQIRSKAAGPAYYSIDGTWIMVSEATPAGDLTIWNAADLEFQNRLPQLGRKLPNQAVSPDYDLVAAFGNQDLTVYDFKSQEEILFKKIIGVFDDIQAAVFLDPSTLAYAKKGDDAVYLADLKTKKIKQLSRSEASAFNDRNPDLGLITREEEIQSLGFEPLAGIQSTTQIGNYLILEDGLLDLPEKEMLHQGLVNAYDWSHACMQEDGSVALIDPSQPPFPNKVTKGDLFINFMDLNAFKVLSKKIIEYNLPDGIEETAISPNGSIVAAGLYDGSIYLWDAKSGEQLADLRAHSKVYEIFGLYGAVANIVFDDDGSHFATAGRDGTIKVWSTEDFKLVKTINGSSPAFSPDGSFLAYISGEKRVNIVPLFENTPPVSFDGHTALVTKLLFSPDSSLLISGSQDKTVKIWSVVEQTLLMDLPQAFRVSSLALNPDGTHLYVSTYDGVISAWGYAQ